MLANLVGRPTCLRCGPFAGLHPVADPFGSRQAPPIWASASTMYYKTPVTRDSSVTCTIAYLPATINLISWHIAVRVYMNHSTGGAARDCDIMHKSSQPAPYLDRQVSSSTLLVRHSSGILTWIRQQAAGRPTGVASSMSPWTIKVATQRRV